MNALELLKEDHQRVSALFDQIEQASEMADRRRAFEKVRRALESHSHIEEIVFYPFFQNKSEFRDLIEEAYEEHQEMKVLLDEIEECTDPDDFEDKIDELIDSVQHHVDEEENELFPRIETDFDSQELEELGAKLEEAKQETPEAA